MRVCVSVCLCLFVEYLGKDYVSKSFADFYFMYMNALPSCVSMHSIHALPSEIKKGQWIPGIGVTG